MKLSEINLNRETLARFVKKQWTVVLSLAVFIVFSGITAWSFMFIYNSINNEAFRFDDKKVVGEITAVDLSSYNRLKDKWKDFQEGKYVGSINSAAVNSDNSNNSNAAAADINSANVNGNGNANINQ